MRAVVRDRELRPDEPGCPLRPARVVEDLGPRLRELKPEILDDERPEPAGILRRAPYELGIVDGAGTADQPGRVRMLDRGRVGSPDDVAHQAPFNQPLPAPPVSAC